MVPTAVTSRAGQERLDEGREGGGLLLRQEVAGAWHVSKLSAPDGGLHVGNRGARVGPRLRTVHQQGGTVDGAQGRPDLQKAALVVHLGLGGGGALQLDLAVGALLRP